MAAGSCAPKGGSSPPPGAERPDWTSVREAWNSRAQKVRHLYGRGIFEVRWTDEDGAGHVDQGDLDLWYEASKRLATRISKFGSTVAVTGVNEQSIWVYIDQGGVLYRGTHDPDRIMLLAHVPFDPEAYLFMLGLAEFPGDMAATSITWDGTRDEWILALSGGRPGLPDRLWLVPGNPIPRRMEFDFKPGTESLAVEYNPARTKQVRLSGASMNDWPIFSNAWAIEMTRGGELQSRSLVVFDELSTEVEDEPMDRVFDLEIMIEGLGPERIESIDLYGQQGGSGE